MSRRLLRLPQVLERYREQVYLVGGCEKGHLSQADQIVPTCHRLAGNGHRRHWNEDQPGQDNESPIR